MKLLIISMILLLMNLQVFKNTMHSLLSSINFPFNIFGSQLYFPVVYSSYFIIASILILTFILKSKISTRIQLDTKTVSTLLIGNFLIIVYFLRLSYNSFEFSMTNHYLSDFAVILLALALLNVFMTLKPKKNTVLINTNHPLANFQRYTFIIGLIVLFAQFQPFEDFSRILYNQIPFIKSLWVIYLFKLFVSSILIFIYIKISHIHMRITNNSLAYKLVFFGVIFFVIYFVNANFKIINFLDKNYYFSIMSQLLLLIGLIQILLNLSAHQLNINKPKETNQKSEAGF